MTKRARSLLVHITGCLLFLSLPVFFSPDFSSSLFFLKVPFFQSDFAGYVLLIIFFYLSYYYFIPKFYMNKEYLAFFIFILVAYMAIVIIPQLFIWLNPDMGHFQRPPGMRRPPPPGNPWLRDLGKHFYQFAVILVFALVLRISNRLRQTEKEKLDAQLSYMKAQMNPHFLFNTLNSIYSLAIERSDATAPAIVKLSGMMRYVLSESQNDFVPLQKEADYIKNYIELQQLRFQDSIRLEFEISGEAAGKKIAPLVLIPFIENAFKHGINPEESSEIHIHIHISDRTLNLHVLNHKVHVHFPMETKSGLGIENTKQRLLFLYPGKHQLSIQNNAELFTVSLQLDLS
jgi:hypothetical protein